MSDLGFSLQGFDALFASLERPSPAVSQTRTNAEIIRAQQDLEPDLGEPMLNNITGGLS